MSREKIKSAMLFGLKRLLSMPKMNTKKIQDRIDNIDFVVDFAIEKKRGPTDYELQEHLASQEEIVKHGN